MPDWKMTACALTLPLVVASCASAPPVTCPKPPPPPARLMQPAPDLMTPLNGIILLSESESKLPEVK